MLNPVPTSYIYEPPTDPWLTVLHADNRLVVFDKPSGLLTVPGKDPALADCLEARAREKWPTATLVHRLDKDTSGIVLMALDKKALGILGQQFEKRRTKKRWPHADNFADQITCPRELISPVRPRTKSAEP